MFYRFITGAVLHIMYSCLFAVKHMFFRCISSFLICRSTKFLLDKQTEYWSPLPFYFLPFLPQDIILLVFFIFFFSVLIPPLLSFFSHCSPPLPSHANCLSLWKLASLANPCSDRRAKCVLLTINIT